jgi:hypothetical protein
LLGGTAQSHERGGASGPAGRPLESPWSAPWSGPGLPSDRRARLGASSAAARSRRAEAHRRQPAREHPLAASAGTVLRHQLPTQLRSRRDCAACRRSAPPRCGWQRPPPTPSRRPQSQLLCSWSCRQAAPGSMVAPWTACRTRGTPRPEPPTGPAALLMLLLQDEEARAQVWHATAPSNSAHNYGTYGVDPLWWTPWSALAALPVRSQASRGNTHCLLRWAVSQSFHQALLHPTRPHWPESRPNLTCLDPTGAV